MKNNSQINMLISKLSNRLFNIKKISNKTTHKSRIQLVKSIVIGKLNHTLPFLINSTQRQLEKLNSILIKSARRIIGSPCLKWSSNRLLNKSKLNNIWHMKMEHGLNFIHEIIINQEPESIHDLYTKPTRPRHYRPKTK